MNGNYYPNPTFPGAVNQEIPNGPSIMSDESAPSLSMEQSYIENILRLNKGKKVKAYVTFPDSTEWKNKVFSGIIEEAGRDHLIISNPNTGEWDLILMIYLNYVTFDEKINYSHAYSEKTFDKIPS